jgi:hypothetical protein
MDAEGETRLRKLSADFEDVTGTAFSHFHCPILFRDENVELCKAHIVNQAFSSIGRHWTVQRKDVDGFFGRCFESDFVDIQYEGDITASKAIVDKALAKRFRPQVLIDGQPVPYYYGSAATLSPADHAKVQFEGDHGTADLRLKLTPTALEATDAANLQIRVERDLRLPALVSLIKVAHLTLFRMLGYRYALSVGGHFMGWSILGEFYSKNHHLDKKVVIENAETHFAEFCNLVRPVISHDPHLEGTVVDNLLYVCETATNVPWAFMVFATTTNALHAIVVPILEHSDGIARFISFLKSGGGTVHGRLSRYEGGEFKASPKVTAFTWPAAGFRS